MATSAASTSDFPSTARGRDEEELEIDTPAFRCSFYRYAQMYDWSEDCLQRIKAMSVDPVTYGPELCLVFHRILLYYESMEETMMEILTRNRLAAEAANETVDHINSPASPGRIHEEDDEEQLNGLVIEEHGDEGEDEDLDGQPMDESEEEEEQRDPVDDRESTSHAVERAVDQPIVVNQANRREEREEERMAREPSLYVYRTAIPQNPLPLKTCKIEVRSSRDEEENEEGTTTNASSSASTSHADLPRDSLQSTTLPSFNTPMLRIKQEPPENPFLGPSTPPHMPSIIPRLIAKKEPLSHSPAQSKDIGASQRMVQPEDIPLPVLAAIASPPLNPPSIPSLPSSSPQSSHSSSHLPPVTPSTVPVSSPSRETLRLLRSQLEKINLQIHHLNGIKDKAMNAFRQARTDGLTILLLAVPLNLIPLDGYPLTMDFFYEQCTRVTTEARSLDESFDRLHCPPESYVKVNNKIVLMELDRICSVVKKHEEEKKDPERKERREDEKKKKRMSDPVKRIKSHHKSPRKSSPEIIKKDKDPKVLAISAKAKEFVARNAEKRARTDATLPAENGEPLVKKWTNEINEGKAKRRAERDRREEERRIERERREGTWDLVDIPSTSRGTMHEKNDDRVDNEWCAFCQSLRFHSALTCPKYDTFEKRQARQMKLMLCYHCLEAYNPLVCKSREHMKPCTSCHKHRSHPAMCRNRPPFLHARNDFPRSPDRRNGRMD